MGELLSRRKGIFLVLSSVIILIIIGFVWMQARKKSAQEGFETNIDTIYNYITGEDGGNQAYVFDDNTATVAEKPEIEFRPCALYYTDNIDLCDDTVNNWYIRPINELRSYRDQLIATNQRSAVQEEQLQDVLKVLADRENGNLPGGVCKVEFPGWVEPTLTPTGEPYPYKNKAMFDNTNRMYPDDWAFCFKSAPNEADAIAQSKNFADEYIVKSSDTAGDYFGDGKVYSKISFTTINLDSNMPKGAVARAPRATSVNEFICATQPPQLPNVPSTMLIFELTDDVLRSMYLGRYNADKLTFDQINNSQVIFQGLFETRLSGRSLYIVPKMLYGTVYMFGFDVCGRLSANASPGVEFSMSLVRDLGIQPRLLYTAPSTSSPTFGTLDQLQARLTELDKQINGINAEIASLNSVSTTPKYAQGHVRYTYKLQMNNPPSMANVQALDIIFQGIDPSTQLPNAILQTREIIKTAPSERTYANDFSRVKYGYVLEGFINIGNGAAGRYYFNLNTDEGGDFMIENMIVASHYNYHTMDNRGVKSDFRLDKNKYYRFRVRMAQWTGGSGVVVQWKTGTQTVYTDIPANVLFYDENDTKRYQASLRQKDVATATSDKALVQQTITSIQTRRDQYMKLAFQGIRNRRLTQWKDYISVDGKLYVDIGSIDGTLGRSDEQALGQVILQEQAVSIVAGVREYPSPVSRFDGMVQYSISFWIYIGQTFKNWTNVFHHGVNDDWSQGKTGDRTPGIWIHPNSTRLHFRQRSSGWANDGCDTLEGLPLNRWTHVVAVVNGTNDRVLDQPRKSIQLYINGQKLPQGANGTNFRQLGGNNVWHWGPQTGKKARIGLNGAIPNLSKGAFVQKVYWYNRVLGAEEIADIYANSGVLRNRRSECRTQETPTVDAYGWKTSTVANLDVQCQKDEVLTGVSLVQAGQDKAKYSFDCCRVTSDDPITITSSSTASPSTNYVDGNTSMLTQHNLDCQTKALQQFNLTANPDRDFAYYDYTCGEYSSKVNMNVKCTPRSTTWANDNGTLQPLAGAQVKCGDQEYLSRIQVARDEANKKIRYDYSCCEVGGL